MTTPKVPGRLLAWTGFLVSLAASVLAYNWWLLLAAVGFAAVLIATWRQP